MLSGVDTAPAGHVGAHGLRVQVRKGPDDLVWREDGLGARGTQPLGDVEDDQMRGHWNPSCPGNTYTMIIIEYQ